LFDRLRCRGTLDSGSINTIFTGLRCDVIYSILLVRTTVHAIPITIVEIYNAPFIPITAAKAINIDNSVYFVVATFWNA